MTQFDDIERRLEVLGARLYAHQRTTALLFSELTRTAGQKHVQDLGAALRVVAANFESETEGTAFDEEIREIFERALSSHGPD